MNLIGPYNASTNTPDLDISPSGVIKGDTYHVSAAGAFFSADVVIDDVLIAKVNGASQLSDWTVLQKRSGLVLSLPTGGTGINIANVTNGQLLIGHGANNGFVVADPVGANGVTVTKGAGTLRFDLNIASLPAENELKDTDVLVYYDIDTSVNKHITFANFKTSLGTLFEEHIPDVSAWFEIVNAGQPGEYLKCLKPLAGVSEIQAFSDFGQFPPDIWDSMPVATAMKLGGVQLTNVDPETKFFRGDGTWQVINDGTFDHSGLQNLAYDDSGHTGFAREIHNLIDTTNHPVTGLTTGHFLRATGATAYAFGALLSTDVLTAISDIFTIEGIAPNQYLRCKLPLAGDAEILAFSDSGQFSPATIAGIAQDNNTDHFLRGDGTWQTVTSMVYPGAGIPVSLGVNGWDTSITPANGYLKYTNGVWSWDVGGVSSQWTTDGSNIYYASGNAIIRTNPSVAGWSLATAAGSLRWIIRTGTTETGNNVGSDLIFCPRNDDGTARAEALSIIRANGNVRIVGVGNKLTFDTTNGVSTAWITTVNDYVLRLYNGRGTTCTLDLTNDGNAILKNGSNASQLFIEQDNATAGTYMWSDSATGDFILGRYSLAGASKTEQLRIANSGGCVGIGMTPAGDGRLYVQGLDGHWSTVVQGGSTAGSSWGLVVKAGTNSSDFNSYFTNRAGGLLFTIRGDGLAAFTGSVNVSGEVTAYYASDKYLKQEIKSFEAFDIIDRLHPKTFKWNEKARKLNEMKDDRNNFGLIAQEVEKVLPELIHPIYDKYKSVDYIQLVPILLQAIKELKQEVKDLKPRIYGIGNN